MADLAANVIHKTQPRAGRHSFPVANGVTVYAGQLVGIEGGYANHWADGANDVFGGILLRGDDPNHDGTLLGDTSASPIPEVTIDCSGVTLMHLDSVGGTPTQAKVGDLVYCGTSNTDDITLDSSGRNHPIGWLSRYRSATDVDVTLFTPEEMLAQATA